MILKQLYGLFLELLYVPVMLWLRFCVHVDEHILCDNPVGTILLIHGHHGCKSQWYYNINELSKNYDVHTIQLDMKGSIETNKQSVVNRIKNILTNNHQLIIVGHSMGGLVASYSIENSELRDSNRIAKIITLGTPWLGAPLLSLIPQKFLGTRHRQMTTNSEFLTDLNSKVLLSDHNYVFCGSYFDIKVPYEYCAPPLHEVHNLGTHSHNSMIMFNDWFKWL